MNIDIDVEGIAKDAIAEPDKIAADEATRAAHKETVEKALRRSTMSPQRPLMMFLPQERLALTQS
jgi:hypothetical protein